MLNQDNNYMATGTAFAQSSTYDAGLRAHMIRIFNTVAAGLAVSGFAAFAVFSVPALQAIFLNPMVNMIVGIGLLVFLWFGMNPNKMMQQSLGTAQLKYYAFTALLGTTLSYVFLLYTQTAILRVFFITAATFGATSLIGYTTKRDLTGMGSFLLMGLIGIVIASLVNMFMHSTGLAFMVSILGVLIFTGLIAFQTQQAKRLYNPANGDDANNKLAIFNALGLYINFINLFQTLLSLMGNRN
jgi:FtsH-binding integral membrane protein